MLRYYICGQIGAGTNEDPYRPELVDALPADIGWAANQEMSVTPDRLVPADRFVVNIASDDLALHEMLAYEAVENPTGYDWFEVADDGTVTLHAE